MTFPPSQRVVYEKNPLESVICQLRFPAILKIGAEDPTGYQERVRTQYPLLNERPALDLGIALPQSLGLPAEFAKLLNAELTPARGHTVYDFSTPDAAWKISLARDFLALTTTRYPRWEEFRRHLAFSLQALEEQYTPAFFTRLGLRYRNVIRRSTIGLQGQPWSELLMPHIAAELSSADVADAVKHITHQVTIALEDQLGLVKIQHGIPGGVEADDAPYLIDADLFTEERTEIAHAIDRLDKFNREAGRLFRWCITERVHQALGPRPI